MAVYDFDVGSRKFTNLDVEAAIKRFGVGSRHRWSGNESAQEVLDTIASTRNLSIDELLEILGRDKERTFMTLEGLKLPRRLILRVWNHIKSNKATTATANESNNMSKFAHMNLEAIAAEVGGVVVRANAGSAKSLRAERVLETALDAFFASVQKQCGNKYGDIAGEFMSDEENAITKLLMPYVKREVAYAQSGEK